MFLMSFKNSKNKCDCLFSEFGSSQWIVRSRKWYRHKFFFELNSATVQHSIESNRNGIQHSEKTMMVNKISQAGLDYSGLEALVGDCCNCSPIACYFAILFFQKMTRWRSCRNCRGRNCVKYVWTEILALSLSHVGTWPHAMSVQNHSSSVQSAAET